MHTRYFLMELREVPGEIIDIRTRQPLPAALPTAEPEWLEEPPMSAGRWLGLWLDVTASLAIIALCAAFWVELML